MGYSTEGSFRKFKNKAISTTPPLSTEPPTHREESRAGLLRPVATMATTSNMFLYSLTVQPPTNVTQAVLGQFSGTKEQHVAVASGSRLSLLRPDPSQGKVVTLLSHDIFGIIRAMAAFRLAGSNKGKSARALSKASLSDFGSWRSSGGPSRCRHYAFAG